MKKFLSHFKKSVLGLSILLIAQIANATWYPLALTVPQYENGAGVPYSGAVLKAYAAGTSTNIPFATDDTGATTANSIALNSNGFPSLTGTTIIPYIDQEYKLSLYPSQTAANSNTGAIWTIDNISPTTVNFNDSAFTGTTSFEDISASGDTSLHDVIINDSINDVNNNAVIGIAGAVSPVNYIRVTNAATGGSPIIASIGGDTNIPITITPKGAAGLLVGAPTGTATTGDVNISGNYKINGAAIGNSTSAGSFAKLKILVTSNTASTVTADSIITEDSNGFLHKSSAVNLSISIAASGENGLDTGSVASNTWYNVFAIYNPTTLTTAGLLSVSATAPTMPSGYTYKARIGAIKTDISSTNLFRTVQYGRKAQYIVGTSPATFPRMASGSAGSITVPTWVSISVSSYVPPTAGIIYLGAYISNGNTAIAPNNSYGANNSATNPPPVTIGISAQSATIPAELLLESSSIYWANDGSANSAVYCRGWEDNL